MRALADRPKAGALLRAGAGAAAVLVAAALMTAGAGMIAATPAVLPSAGGQPASLVASGRTVFPVAASCCSSHILPGTSR